MNQWTSISKYCTIEKSLRDENHTNHFNSESIEHTPNKNKTITEKFTESMKYITELKSLNKNEKKTYNIEGTNKLLKPVDGYISRFRYNGFVKSSHWKYYDDNLVSDYGPETEAQYNYRMKKKQKFCILMGFAGQNYYGMQYNCSLKTIEDELFRAMVKNDWILPEHLDKPSLVEFIHGSRTDRGVSAARMNVSVVLRK